MSKAKTPSTPKPAAKSKTKTGPKAPPASPMNPAVTKTTTPIVTAPELRKPDLLDAVTTRTGLKRQDVKPVLEAVLEELGLALEQDRDWNLPPFAKLKVKKVKDLSNGRVTMARLRRPRAPDPASEAD